MSSRYDISVRVLLIGDSNVGKSSILLRYSEDKFCSSYVPTIGIDFRSKYPKINDKSVRIQMWDTAGQERFKGIMPAYYRNIQAAVLVYDVTNRSSYENIKNWMMEIEKNCSKAPIISLLLANKIDLEENRQVGTQEGVDLANAYGLHFFEVSASNDDDSVHNAINYLSTTIVDNLQNESNDSINLKLDQPKKSRISKFMGYLPTKQEIKNKLNCCIPTKFQHLD